jgi:hypothetical protein
MSTVHTPDGPVYWADNPSSLCWHRAIVRHTWPNGQREFIMWTTGRSGLTAILTKWNDRNNIHKYEEVTPQ